MDIFEKKQDVISILTLNGRLDSNTSPSFEKKIFDSIENGSRSMILDFGQLDYISSAGLRVILKATKALKNNQGEILLCALEDYVQEVFEISGFDTFLPIYPTLEAALQKFSPS